ncbi:DUF6009 family protein [Streptomyces sp. NPDC006195]|uniref:DUF6009 family protein n=1 Tax=unclassified Streptomyces TaxID=2593676 RepID=UPI0033BDE2A0
MAQNGPTGGLLRAQVGCPERGHARQVRPPVFWVKDYDRSELPNGTYGTSAPSAVDPRTVAPGVWGELTERAWGGPLPD